MAQAIADLRDVTFVLHEQLGIHNLLTSERFSAFDRKTVDLIMKEARNLALRELLPARRSGDEEGCRFEGGKVFCPPSFHGAYEKFREGEWLAIVVDRHLSKIILVD